MSLDLAADLLPLTVPEDAAGCCGGWRGRERLIREQVIGLVNAGGVVISSGRTLPLATNGPEQVMLGC